MTDKPSLLPKYYKDSSKLERAAQFIESVLSKSLSDHLSRQQKWVDYDNCYRLIDNNLPKFGCKVVDHEPQIIVDVMKSNLVEAFFANDPSFKYKGTEDTDQEQADIMTAYRADHLRRIDLRSKFERSIHQKLVYGTAVVKTPWVKEVTKRKVREALPQFDKDGYPKLDEDGEVVTELEVVEKEFVKMDDTDWEYVSLFDFIPVGRGTNIQKIEGVLHRSDINWDDLYNSEYKEEEIDGEKVITGVYTNLSSIDTLMGSKYDLVEYWGKIPYSVVTGEESDSHRCFEGVISALIDWQKSLDLSRRASHSVSTGEIAQEEDNHNPNIAIRFQENPFWHGERPFLVCPHKPVDDELYGIGMIEPIIPKWHELNTTIRQLVDNKTIQLNMPTIEDANSNVQRSVSLLENPRIKANDVGSVVPFPINDFSANGYRLIASQKDELRRGSGALEVIQGTPLNSDRTSATEASQTFQQASVRLKSMIRLIDEKLFKAFLDRSYQNDQQFAELERVVRVVGAKGVNWETVRPEDIWGTFDIITQGPLQFENKVMKVNKLSNFFAIASRAPQFFNIPELGKKIYMAMEIGPEHEANQIVNTPSNIMSAQKEIEEEIVALSFGQPVPVKIGQNHALHIETKMAAVSDLYRKGKVDQQVYKVFEENVDGHLDYLKTQSLQQSVASAQLAQNGGEVPIENVGATPSLNPTQQASNGGEFGQSGIA